MVKKNHSRASNLELLVQVKITNGRLSFDSRLGLIRFRQCY
jgi:hypothetical protein